MLRGIHYFEKGNKKDALKDFVKSIAVNKSNDKAWNNMGKALYEIGAKDKALACYKTALNINANNQIAIEGIKKINSESK